MHRFHTPDPGPSGRACVALFLTSVVLGFALTTLALTSRASAQPAASAPPTPAQSPGFASLAIFITPENARVGGGGPARGLGSYQVEITASHPHGDVLLTGVIGGDAPFSAPPAYDPAALHESSRIIIADFTTSDDLPTAKTRVATLSLMLPSEDLKSTTITARLVAVGDGDAAAIDASVTTSLVPPSRP